MQISELDCIHQLNIHVDVFAATTIKYGNHSITDNTKIILPNQTHSTNVEWVSDTTSEYPNTDALITNMSDIAIGIRTADCIPLLLYASDIKTIAAIHAGWKGTLNGIVDNVISHLIQAGAKTTNIFAGFGPTICQQCFEVDNSLANEFINSGFGEYVSINNYIDPISNLPFKEKKPHIDLVGINIKRLINHNIPQNNINKQSLCTRHQQTNNQFLFHSWRRNNQTPYRNITFIKFNTES